MFAGHFSGNVRQIIKTIFNAAGGGRCYQIAFEND